MQMYQNNWGKNEENYMIAARPNLDDSTTVLNPSVGYDGNKVREKTNQLWGIEQRAGEMVRTSNEFEAVP